MRIACFVFQFPCITETFILNQIIGLLDAGHEVLIFARKPQDTSKIHLQVEQYNLLEMTYYYQMPLGFFPFLRKMVRILCSDLRRNIPILLKTLKNFKSYPAVISRRELFHLATLLKDKGSFDIIHCHFGQAGLVVLQLEKIGILRGKIITSFRGLDISRYLQENGYNPYFDLFQKGNAFLPVCEYFKNRLIHLGCEERKITVHHSGIDCPKIPFTPQKSFSHNSFRIISIGRLVEKKGFKYSILAIAQLWKTHKNINYHIYGNGPLKESLETLIRQLNLEKAVRLFSERERDEIAKILEDYDILLAPSMTASDGDQEGIPNVLKEAMAAGVPVVSTYHSGIPELVEDGVSGFLVHEKDICALAEKIDYLINHPEIWAGIRLAGRAVIEERFNLLYLNNELLKIYKRLTDL